jgi:hypothetical protein
VQRDSPLATLIQVAGAAGAAVGFVYAIGGLVLSLRYEGFGLNGQESAALTSREVLLFSGATTLARWILIGVAIFGVIWVLLRLLAWLLGDQRASARASELPRARWIQVGTIALALALILLSHVWWPAAATAAIAAIAWESTQTVPAASKPEGFPTGWSRQSEKGSPRSRIRRWVVIAAAVGLVAVAYEADRLRYRLNWSCVDVTEEREHTCGILIAQNDRGFYIGAPPGQDARSVETAPYRLVFVPQERVIRASSQRREARVIESNADARREPPVARVLSIDVR